MNAVGLIQTKNSHTDRCQSTAAFSHGGATSNETDNEKQSSNSNDGHCWDEGVNVFKEVIVVVVCNEDISSNVTQDSSSCLQGKQTFHWCVCAFQTGQISGDIWEYIQNNNSGG